MSWTNPQKPRKTYQAPAPGPLLLKWILSDEPVLCECLCGHRIKILIDEFLCPDCELLEIIGAIGHGSGVYTDPLESLLKGM